MMFVTKVLGYPLFTRLDRHRLENVLSFGFVRFLFAGFERQRLGELNDDTAQETIQIINPEYVPRTREVGHIEGTIRTITGDAKASGNLLPVMGTVIAGMACKRRRLAR